MASEGSVTSSGSRIRQFGLYRSIDARTEEFLRLSRKRQIRQGCACAAVSTAITVTVVVVILLIYEYAIAVEWSLVQKLRGGNGTFDFTNITHDTPFADRLDRSFFGFDQDYYERMPLLVNALQESNYVDPVIEMSRPLGSRPYSKNSTIPKTFSPNAFRQSKIRKSSPRPFIFEYRSATPLPFSKTYGSRSWVDSYRNAQRLQNIRQVIRYLEKTINAKAGDMHTKPTNSHTSIAFSGVYVEPKIEKDKSDEYNSMEPLPQNSNRVETYANHNEDPLFNFKPDSPGEVNLLADTLFRFSPVSTPSLIEDTEPTKVPMFRRIPYRKNCRGNQCGENFNNEKLSKIKSSTERNTELSTSTKSFSVMLNLYPLKPNTSPELKLYDEKTKPPLEKIYITTSKPLILFRKKPAPMRRTYYRYKRPRYLSRNRNTSEAKSSVDKTGHTKDYNNSTTMIVNVDFYSPKDKNGFKNQSIEPFVTSTRPSSSLPITEKPVELFAGQVEDHHDGSSGFISIIIPEQTTTLTSPQVTTTVIPFFDTTTASTEINPWATRATNPPDVFKFSAEDAKVPEHYINMATTQAVPMDINKNSQNWPTTQTPIEMNRRGINLDTTQIDKIHMNWETTQSSPTGMEERNIFWETTETPIGIDRRSNLVTTQAVPMETIRVYMDWLTTQTPIDVEEKFETTEAPNKMDRGNMKWATTQAPTEMDRYGQIIDKPINEGRERLITKLRNGSTTTERENPTTTETEETTTLKTYVPQINGHYRNIVATRNQTKYSPESYRKRKLEMAVAGFRSYVPMYTEIIRNKTMAIEDSE